MPQAPKKRRRKSDKPILLLLQGASGKFANDIESYLIPRLGELFEVRRRPDKRWKGWDPGKNATQVAGDMIPADGEQFFVMGFSFGARVAVSMAVSAAAAEGYMPAGIILMGYPLYGPKGTPERVEALEALPTSLAVLAISGDKDPFVTKNVPSADIAITAQQQQLMECNKVEALLRRCILSESVDVRIVPRGSHSCFPSSSNNNGNKAKAATTEKVVAWLQQFIIAVVAKKKKTPADSTVVQSFT